MVAILVINSLFAWTAERHRSEQPGGSCSLLAAADRHWGRRLEQRT